MTAAISAAGVVSSMAQVYSVNVVGFVNVSLTNGYNLLVNPLKGTNDTIGTIIPTLNNASGLIHWNTNTQSYYTEIGFDTDANGPLGWDDPSVVIHPGEAFFIRSFGNFTLTFVGEVRQGTLATPLTAAYTFAGSQVPIAGYLSGELGFAPSNGDAAITWDVQHQRWNTALGYDTEANGPQGWDDGTGPNLGIAQGAVILRGPGGATTWTKTFNVGP